MGAGVGTTRQQNRRREKMLRHSVSLASTPRSPEGFFKGSFKGSINVLGKVCAPLSRVHAT